MLELGYINITNQYIELAVRCYERECGDEPIESIARSVNLSISTLPEDYYARVSKGYLVGIQSCFEKYLLAFKELCGNPTENIEKYDPKKQNMPRTKGSKNRITASTDFDAQIAKLQKDKAMLEEGLSKTVAHIEELKTDIKSLRESLKPQKAEIKQTEKEIAKLEAKKAAEVAKKVETEAVLKKLLASGMTADDVLKKLK